MLYPKHLNNLGPFANQLRKLEFPGIKVIPNPICQRNMPFPESTVPIIPYMHLCAGGITGIVSNLILSSMQDKPPKERNTLIIST